VVGESIEEKRMKAERICVLVCLNIGCIDMDWILFLIEIKEVAVSKL
jgi:hypothetical protein